MLNNPLEHLSEIIGRGRAMEPVLAILPQIAESDSTVLLEGASGTGKELFARAIHKLSPRRAKKFVAVNCGALPDTLLESELFGYKAGAFTDARRDKPGRFALANGGTVFLDEICDISPAMQVRLLRVLQERVFEPLGGVESVKTDVRIVAATNKSIDEQVRSGLFREDLYYRINVFRLELPSLRERLEDLPLLIEHCITRFNKLKGKNISGLSNTALARLLAHDFPGNVRELENIIEHAFVLCRGEQIDLAHLPNYLRVDKDEPKAWREGMTLAAVEKLMIANALKRHQGNRPKAAQELGVDPSTLFRKTRDMKSKRSAGLSKA
jgi:transcriptional regulator with PAS, ATPase and Fis domain